MTVEFTEIPGWRFTVDEVSAGVYKAIGIDQQGRNIDLMGTDPDALIEKCRQSALEMMNALRRQSR